MTAYREAAVISSNVDLQARRHNPRRYASGEIPFKRTVGVNGRFVWLRRHGNVWEVQGAALPLMVKEDTIEAIAKGEIWLSCKLADGRRLHQRYVQVNELSSDYSKAKLGEEWID